MSPDSTCLRNAATPLACILGVLRDSASMRDLFLMAGRRLLERAQHSDRALRQPSTPAEYYRAAFGPQALLRAGATAGIAQLLDRPHRWPRTSGGYALRFGTTLASEALATGIRYETVRWLNERMAAFEPCSCQDPGDRLLHALGAPFRADRLDGTSHFSILAPLTELSSGMVFATASGGLRPKAGLEAGMTGMVTMSIVSILREFRPWEKWFTN